MLYRCNESNMNAANLYLFKKKKKLPMKLNARLNSNTNDI